LEAHQLDDTTTHISAMSEVRNRANGNGVATQPKSAAPSEQPQENIFLFIPNLIGSSLYNTYSRMR
jgi:hypothetical protein